MNRGTPALVAPLFLAVSGADDDGVHHAQIDVSEERLRILLGRLDRVQAMEGDDWNYVVFPDRDVWFYGEPDDERLLEAIEVGAAFLAEGDWERDDFGGEFPELRVSRKHVWWVESSYGRLWETTEVGRDTLLCGLLYVVTAERIESTLREIIRDADPWMVVEAIEAGFWLPGSDEAGGAPRASISADAMAPLLTHENAELRRRAILALARLAPDSREDARREAPSPRPRR